jgi:hypothetical protein
VLDVAQAAFGSDVPRALANSVWSIHDIAVQSDGTVRSLTKSGKDYLNKHPIHLLEGMGRTGSILLRMDRAFPDGLDTTFPTYFKGT